MFQKVHVVLRDLSLDVTEYPASTAHEEHQNGDDGEFAGSWRTALIPCHIESKFTWVQALAQQLHYDDSDKQEIQLLDMLEGFLQS